MTHQTKDPVERKFNGGVGERVRCRRELLGMSVAQLAEAVGVSRMAVYNWEAGRSGVTPYNLVPLAAALRCPVDDLVPPVYMDHHLPILREVARARAELDRAKEAFQASIRTAVDQGVPGSRIGKAAGLSKGRISQIAPQS